MPTVGIGGAAEMPAMLLSRFLHAGGTSAFASGHRCTTTGKESTVKQMQLAKSALCAGLLVAGAVSLLLVVGCSDDDPTGPDERARLSEELHGALDAAADGEGESFFRMPASDELSLIPQDPRNPLTEEKVRLGKLLFHETGLLTDPRMPGFEEKGSCASCHHVDAGFQAGVAQGIGDGGAGYGVRGEGRERDANCPPESLDVQPIRSPSAMNAAWQSNMLWNGQFGATGVNEGTEYAWTPGTPKEFNQLGYEGIETQAIAGQKVHRMDILRSVVWSNETYRNLFDEAFPERPTGERMTRETAGLAIAAYERTLLANAAPFQRWLRGDEEAMTEPALRGALLFFGKAECSACHTGPALNAMEFYALGMGNLQGGGTYGTDPSKPENRGRGGFTGREADNYKFKVPQLYNLTDSPFYGHGATFSSVRSVIAYKNAAVAENHDVPAAQIAEGFHALGLTEVEIDDLTAFLETGLYDGSLERYVPDELPSGLCFPNNDAASRHDLGCQ